MRFGHNIWLEGPIDLDQRVSTVFCKIFSGTPHSTIFGARKYSPKYAKYGQICIFGTYFGATNMVQWGVPEKILQNAVQDALVLGQ